MHIYGPKFGHIIFVPKISPLLRKDGRSRGSEKSAALVTSVRTFSCCDLFLRLITDHEYSILESFIL